jgi:HK97 family phage prohead protease/HK97 family phage major capsid protein
MTIKDKVFHLSSQFTKELLPTADETIDSIFISGYASVNSPDRVGDVVPSSVWEKGMVNYLKNPIVLAYHDHDDPVGRVTDHKVDSTGLWVKARISAAATEVFNLIKDNVLTAFSVSFRVIDAEYNAATELFVIKELELIEISVVSVPCNQDTLFSLSKSFTDDEEYKLFKTQFVPKSDSAKGLESSTETNGTTSKEIGMDPKELQAMLDNAANAAAERATTNILAAQKAEQVAREKAAADEATMQARINAAVAAVTPSTTGAEKLMADITKRFEDQTEATKATLAGLESALKEKAAELEAMTKSKMTFKDPNAAAPTYAEKESAYLLSKITNKAIEDTKFGRDLIVKYAGTAQPGTHLASSTWELEVSTNMESEIRRRLVMAPLFRQVNMQTNVMTFPLNPEAGDAGWMANTSWGTTTSVGTTAVHALSAITLNAYKVATSEYLAYEEEEDSLLVLLPVVRDAMVRRVARSIDKAFLLGAGSGADPVKGVLTYDTTSAVNVTNTGKMTVASMASARRDLAAWGLDPKDVTFVVSTDCYFDLLDDTSFQTMDKVGVNATILTGQIGMIGNSPVLVSSMFPTKAGGTTTATTNYAALAIASGNFLVGNQRGLRFDTQDLVETQRKVLVASLRTGLVQLTTNLGLGVSAIRWS